MAGPGRMAADNPHDLPPGVVHISEALNAILNDPNRLCLILINGIGDDVRLSVLQTLRQLGWDDARIAHQLRSLHREEMKPGNIESACALMSHSSRPRQRNLWDTMEQQ